MVYREPENRDKETKKKLKSEAKEVKPMLKPEDNVGDILASHDKKIEALERALTGLVKILLIYTGINSILKALKKNDKLF